MTHLSSKNQANPDDRLRMLRFSQDGDIKFLIDLLDKAESARDRDHEQAWANGSLASFYGIALEEITRVSSSQGWRKAVEIAREALDRAQSNAGAGQAMPGPIMPEPQDYLVQCRCGWMGRVSRLKSLPGLKMGCPECSTEFVPFDRIAWPVHETGEEHGK